jgi:hypothetical protein
MKMSTLTHSQTFCSRPSLLNWQDLLRTLLIPPANNTIASTTAKLDSRIINHKFNQAKIEYPMITATFFSTPHLLLIETIKYYWIVSLGYLKST